MYARVLRVDPTQNKLEGIFALYQPKVEVLQGVARISGVEALARMQGLSGQNYTPNQFLPQVYKNKQERELEGKMLRQAYDHIHQASANPLFDERYANFRVAVNVSTLDNKLVDNVARALEESGLKGNKLELELLEEKPVRNLRAALRAINQLTSYGVTLAIDDCGIAYSKPNHRQSHFRLLEAGIFALKVDRSVVRSAVEGNDRMLKQIVGLANEYNCNAVAEGVETANDARYLTDQGIVTHQGYHYGKPQPLDKIIGHPSFARKLEN